MMAASFVQIDERERRFFRAAMSATGSSTTVTVSSRTACGVPSSMTRLTTTAAS